MVSMEWRKGMRRSSYSMRQPDACHLFVVKNAACDCFIFAYLHQHSPMDANVLSADWRLLLLWITVIQYNNWNINSSMLRFSRGDCRWHFHTLTYVTISHKQINTAAHRIVPLTVVVLQTVTIVCHNANTIFFILCMWLLLILCVRCGQIKARCKTLLKAVR